MSNEIITTKENLKFLMTSFAAFKRTLCDNDNSARAWSDVQFWGEALLAD